MYIYVNQTMSQVEVMFKNGTQFNVPFSEITLDLTIDMVIDPELLREEKAAQELEDRSL